MNCFPYCDSNTPHGTGACKTLAMSKTLAKGCQCHPADTTLPPADRQALPHLARLQRRPGPAIRILSTASHCRGHFSTCPKPQPLELAARGELPGVPADSSVRSSQVPHAQVTAAHPPGVPWLCPLPARSECGTHIPTATAHAGSPSCQQVMDGRCEGRGRALLAPLSPPVTAS